MTYKRKRDEQGGGGLIFVCAAFLLGGILGSLLVPCLSESNTYYLSVISGEGVSFKEYFAANSLLLIAIFVGAFDKRWIWLIPAAVGAKGFLCAFSVTCFVRRLGVRGYLPAFFSVFASSLVSMTAMTLLACRALEYCGNISPRGRGGRVRYDRGYLTSGIISLTIIALAGVLHCCIMPVITFMTGAFGG